MSSLHLHQLRRADGACILSLEGEVDESTVDAFEQGLTTALARSRQLVVDLTSCTISSDGLAALMAYKQCSCEHTPVKLVARESCLLRMLETVGLTTALGTYPTVNAALAS